MNLPNRERGISFKGPLNTPLDHNITKDFVLQLFLFE